MKAHAFLREERKGELQFSMMMQKPLVKEKDNNGSADPEGQIDP
jgi:hypothetical protein